MSKLKIAFFDIGETLVRRLDTGQFVLVDGAFEAVKAFADRHMLTGIISNTEGITRDQLIDLLPNSFDFGVFEPSLVILSSEVGVKKPDRAIFELALHRGRTLIPELTAEECIFCGENLAEIMAAQRSGFFGARVLRTETGTELFELLALLD